MFKIESDIDCYHQIFKFHTTVDAWMIWGWRWWSAQSGGSADLGNGGRRWRRGPLTHRPPFHPRPPHILAPNTPPNEIIEIPHQDLPHIILKCWVICTACLPADAMPLLITSPDFCQNMKNNSWWWFAKLTEPSIYNQQTVLVGV